MEIIVVYLYIVLRVDRRFYIPDGSKGPGDYVKDEGADQEKKADSLHSVRRILSEEEVFDGEETNEERHSKDLEANAVSASE